MIKFPRNRSRPFLGNFACKCKLFSRLAFSLDFEKKCGIIISEQQQSIKRKAVLTVSKKSKRKALARKRFTLFLISVLVVTLSLVILLASSLFVFLKLPSIGIFDKKYTFKIGADNSKSRKSFSYDKNAVMRDGELCLNFSYLAETCGFSVSGDSSELKYLLRNSTNDKLLIVPGDVTVDICGTKAKMSTPAFFSSKGDLFLPCSFVENFIDGVTIEQDEKNDHLYYITYNSEEAFSLTVRSPQKESVVSEQ